MFVCLWKVRYFPSVIVLLCKSQSCNILTFCWHLCQNFYILFIELWNSINFGPRQKSQESQTIQLKSQPSKNWIIWTVFKSQTIQPKSLTFYQDHLIFYLIWHPDCPGWSSGLYGIWDGQSETWEPSKKPKYCIQLLLDGPLDSLEFGQCGLGSFCLLLQ